MSAQRWAEGGGKSQVACLRSKQNADTKLFSNLKENREIMSPGWFLENKTAGAKLGLKAGFIYPTDKRIIWMTQWNACPWFRLRWIAV